MAAWRYLIWVMLIFFGAVASIIRLSVAIDTRDVNFDSPTLITNMSDTKIVGGEEAFIEDHPYQVSFVVNNSFFCGGFIVSENYMLTAAHCAQEMWLLQYLWSGDICILNPSPNGDQIFIERSRNLKIGINLTYSVDPSTVVLRAGSSWRKNGTIIPIAEVIPHPEYDQPAFDKDVAVMKTVDPIEFSDVIQPINLPPKGRSMRGGSSVIVSGWGKEMSGANTIPERLMSVEIPVVDYLLCFPSYFSVLTRNMWCGGNFVFGGQGTCQGDSGGAAIQDRLAVGIVSFGRGCAQRFAPSVFANIAAPTIRDFIKEHTGL